MGEEQEESDLYKLTVCIPIYNTERWIAQCLDSLVAQDIWNRIFVILVDDGSQDGSLEIVQNFSRNYQKQTLLLHHGENKGLLAARYSAIMRIKTPFAMFVDSDDLLPPFACSALYKTIIQKNADIIMGQARTLDGTDISDKNTHFMKHWFQDYNETHNLRLQGDFRIAGLPLWGKIYRSTILKLTVHGTSGRDFPAISTGEDNLLSTAIFMKAQKFFLTNQIVYYYRANNESLISNIKKKSIIEYLLVSLNIWKLAISYHCSKLAELAGSVLNSAEYRFFNSELCFPYGLKMLNLFTSMNKIASKIGKNLQMSLIAEQETRIIEEFSVPRLSETLEIPDYNLYTLSKPKHPAVSIIIPLYDNCNFLDRCLESVLLQTESEIEIILIDCTSSDDYIQLIQNYTARDTRIVVIKHSESKTQWSALNAGLKMAIAPWFMIIDSDDYIDRDTLKILLKEVHSLPQVGLVICGTIGLCEDGSRVKIYDWPTENILIAKPFEKYQDQQRYALNGYGVQMWRRDGFDDDLSFRSSNMKLSRDFDLFIQMTLNFRNSILIIRDRLYYYGINPTYIPSYNVEITLPKNNVENQIALDNRRCSFYRLSVKQKILGIARVLSKKFRVYKILRYLIRTLKCFLNKTESV